MNSAFRQNLVRADALFRRDQVEVWSLKTKAGVLVVPAAATTVAIAELGLGGMAVVPVLRRAVVDFAHDGERGSACGEVVLLRGRSAVEGVGGRSAHDGFSFSMR